MPATDWGLPASVIVAADKLADLGIGVVATLLGILVVYIIARPNIEFADHVFASENPSGSMRYGIHVRPRNRYLRLTEMRVSAHLLMGPEGRQTSVPVPLSRDTWLDVKRSKDATRWAAAPQLFLGEVQWKRHLTRNVPPLRPHRLESVMSEKNARLIVVVVSVSAVFGVTTVSQHTYSVDSVEFLTPAAGESAKGFSLLIRRALGRVRICQSATRSRLQR